MASLLCPAAAASYSSLLSSSFPSRRRPQPSAPLASPAPSSPPRPRSVAAAAAYGYGGDVLMRPFDTQTLLISAAVVSAVSLSLVLGLKVVARSLALSALNFLSLYIYTISLAKPCALLQFFFFFSCLFVCFRVIRCRAKGAPGMVYLIYKFSLLFSSSLFWSSHDNFLKLSQYGKNMNTGSELVGMPFEVRYN